MPNKEKIKRLSQKEYVNDCGLKINLDTLCRCPFCHSTMIERDGSIEFVENKVLQKIDCLNCDKTWQDVYKLVGYQLPTE
jgi:transposase-like protein